MKAALYLRVSTDQQTTANQLDDLTRLATARGYACQVFEETESAAKQRPVLEQVLAAARSGQVNAVIVWALDRLHRSMHGAITTVLELDRLGVQVISLREPWLDTSGPVRQLLVAIFGWVAEQERTRLIERTRAGLERARRDGKRLGRPPVSPVLLNAAADRVGRGESIRGAAREMGIPEKSLRRFLSARK
jgi:putative DNA-invertase from lambdoid prophage Rac